MEHDTPKTDLNSILRGAPGNPVIWNRFLEELVHKLNSESSALQITDLHNLGNTQFLFSANIPLEYKEQYENELNKFDHFNGHISKQPKQIYFSQNLQSAYNQDDSINTKVLANHAFKIGISIPCNKNHALNLIIHRKHKYNDQEQKKYSQILQAIIPSLEDAMHGEQRHKINSQLHHYMWDQFDGYVIIDHHLNILFCDPAYTPIISSLDCITISGNQLHINDPHVAKELTELIKKNGDSGSIRDQCLSCEITLIPISTLQNLYNWECFKNAYILTFTHEKDENPTLNRLTSIYQLSRCEALCAMHFMKTPSIPDVATKTYRSQETVRNHIKHIMQKMGVHSQAELMKKLLTLSSL